MLFSLLALPVLWIFFLWLLPWLEERALSPEERAEKIRRLLEEATPEEIERGVSELLANSLTEQERDRPKTVRSAPNTA